MLYDLTMLKKLTNDNETFIVDMLQTFINTTPPILQRMKDYASQNKIEALGREAHKLIPGVSFMGAQQLQNVLVTIEENAKNNKDIDQMSSLVTEAFAQTDALITCFRSDFNIPG